MRRAVPLSLIVVFAGACGGDEPHYTKEATDPCLETIGDTSGGAYHIDAEDASTVVFGEGKRVSVYFWSSASLARRISERSEGIPGAVNDHEGNVSLFGHQEVVGRPPLTNKDLEKVKDCLA